MGFLRVEIYLSYIDVGRHTVFGYGKLFGNTTYGQIGHLLEGA